MIEAIASVYNLIQSNSDWYSASFFIIVVLYAVLVIGWFFSTDYYDSFVSDIDEVSGFNVFVCSLIGLGTLFNAILGTSNAWSIFYNTILWALFVVPAFVIYICGLRDSIRKRRGKS